MLLVVTFKYLLTQHYKCIHNHRDTKPRTYIFHESFNGTLMHLRLFKITYILKNSLKKTFKIENRKILKFDWLILLLRMKTAERRILTKKSRLWNRIFIHSIWQKSILRMPDQLKYSCAFEIYKKENQISFCQCQFDKLSFSRENIFSKHIKRQSKKIWREFFFIQIMYKKYLFERSLPECLFVCIHRHMRIIDFVWIVHD